MSTEALNYYEILDVPPTADQHRIFKAYKEAQETFSLNNTQLFNVFSEEEAQDWLDLIEEAYRVIGSPNARREYDLELQDKINPALPGFEITDRKDAKPVATNSLSETPLPEGFARTKLSQYEVKSKMEELIASQDLFDGLFLKKVREYKNIGLNQFSQATCIAIRHLYAIENNNFSVLPASVFVRGYIIQYCRILDLDEGKVVPSFMSILKNA
jgi:curved DNA-binding protein CbpA